MTEPCTFCDKKAVEWCDECQRPVCDKHGHTLYNHVDGHLLSETVVCDDCYHGSADLVPA